VSTPSRIRIDEFIGKGYFGRVHKGFHPLHGVVAVKILRRRQKLHSEAAESNTDTDADDNAEEETEDAWQMRKIGLLKEGQRLALARHACVVPVYHIEEIDGGDTIHLVMEYCPGGTLQEAYHAGPLSYTYVRDRMTEVALGLDTLHRRTMIHRDIKPANILLDSNKTAKVSDFGLVTDDLLHGYASQKGYTDHLAFEIHQHQGTSVASDIWAFGMTVYRLLHGHRWYKGRPAPRHLVGKGGFANNLEWLPHIPLSWRKFVCKCMHDDKLKRFRTMHDVLNGLALLPVDPEIHCSYTEEEIVWVWQQRRAWRVRCYRDGRGYSWTASSEAVSPIRRKKLQSPSHHSDSLAESLSEISDYFASTVFCK
jgi:serine/threonine protein kinase